MKKLLAILCAAALALSLAACGADSTTGTADAAYTRYTIDGATALTFSDKGITATDGGDTAYEIDGRLVRDFPSTPSLMRAKPVYTVLPGWKSDVRGITEWDKLPENCRKYVEFIEKEIEVPVRILSTGPKRSEVLYRK